MYTRFKYVSTLIAQKASNKDTFKIFFRGPLAKLVEKSSVNLKLIAPSEMLHRMQHGTCTQMFSTNIFELILPSFNKRQ